MAPGGHTQLAPSALARSWPRGRVRLTNCHASGAFWTGAWRTPGDPCAAPAPLAAQPGLQAPSLKPENPTAPEGGHGRVGRRPPEDRLRRDLEQGGDVLRREVLHTLLIRAAGGATALEVRLDEDMELGPPNFYFRARGRGGVAAGAGPAGRPGSGWRSRAWTRM